MWDRDVPVAAMLLRAMLARSGAGGDQKRYCQADVAPNTEDCILARCLRLPQCHSQTGAHLPALKPGTNVMASPSTMQGMV